MLQSEACVTKPNGGQKADQLSIIKANIHGDFIGSQVVSNLPIDETLSRRSWSTWKDSEQ